MDDFNANDNVLESSSETDTYETVEGSQDWRAPSNPIGYDGDLDQIDGEHVGADVLPTNVSHVSVGGCARPGSEYAILLQRRSQTQLLGLSLYRTRGGDGHFRVARFSSDGLVPAWNRAYPTRKVCVGDTLLKINGVEPHSIPEIHEATRTNKVLILFLRGGEGDLSAFPDS